MRIRSIVIAVGVGLLAHAAVAQDLRENVNRSLFADQKANRVGDAVTIYIMESSSASNDARTNAARSSDISLSGSGQLNGSTLHGGTLGLGTQSTFKGEGSTVSNGNVRAQISARVDSVLPNGTLHVQGSRSIVINGEEQLIRISGIVRPSDIQPDNSVYSYNISDASIVFEGSGLVSRAQGPGLFTRLFHWLF